MEMSLDHYAAFLTVISSFLGPLLVIWQLRKNNKEKESDSLVKLYDINRELLTLGLDHPVLFKILNDEKKIDPVIEDRYLQMWLNQLSLSFTYLQRSVSQTELRESLERNLADFMTMENMRRVWKKHGSFYPTSFQNYVNELIKKHEPHKAAHVHHPKSGG